MSSSILVLWASFLVAYVIGFYPYHRPTPGTAVSDLSSVLAARGSGLSTYSNEFNKNHGLKLVMKRRAPPPDSHPFMRSIAETNAMRRRSSGYTAASSGTPAKRDNTFSIVTAVQPIQTNSVAIHEDGADFSYLSTLQLGSSSKEMVFLIDTGAANTWVMGSNCTSEACGKHNTFGDKDSTTLRNTGDSFNLTYGTGSVSGEILNDTVNIASMSVPLSFGAASITSDDFLTYPMDGILGLGRPASNAMDYPTAMEAIASTNSLPLNLFGIHLQRASDGSTDGELNFGAPDTTRYSAPLAYTDTVADATIWEIPIDDASFNGKLCNFSGKSAIVDTGTSFVLLPPDDAKTLHGLIPGSEHDGETFNVPCSTDMPVQLIISGVPYNISSKDYVGNPVDGGVLCASNIVGRKAFGDDQWLLGDVFLKNVYTVFDFDEDRIGFGVKDASTAADQDSSSSDIETPTALLSSGQSNQASSTSTPQPSSSPQIPAAAAESSSPRPANIASRTCGSVLAICVASLIPCVVFLV